MNHNLDYALQKNGHRTENGETRKSHTILQTVAGVAGNVLEWYDFAVFGYFSDIISQVFFPPNQAGHAALAESFAVFGGAFLMRPGELVACFDAIAYPTVTNVVPIVSTNTPRS
mmetsp:Transcript_37121/g.54584  ORF Transcript_37121/g.54584 Transcript_37121/m.54584 type:complete len:114 (-) Transcript_37121:1471-1812(-)